MRVAASSHSATFVTRREREREVERDAFLFSSRMYEKNMRYQYCAAAGAFYFVETERYINAPPPALLIPGVSRIKSKKKKKKKNPNHT